MSSKSMHLNILTEQQHELLRDLIEREAGAGAAPLPVWIGGQVRHNDVTDSWRWLEGITDLNKK